MSYAVMLCVYNIISRAYTVEPPIKYTVYEDKIYNPKMMTLVYSRPSIIRTSVIRILDYPDSVSL